MDVARLADDSVRGGSGTMDVGKSEGAPMTADNTVEFLDLYNRLERLIRERYNLSRDGGAIAWLLSRDKAPRALRDELDYCREVRNFLQHNERIDGSYAVIPSDAMLDALRSTLERFEGMGAAEDVCTRREKIRVATMDEPLRPVLRDMAEHGYAHVPILADGRVVGVLSESTVLSYLVDDMALEIPETATLKQLERLLALDAHEPGRFAFVARREPADEVAELFQASLRQANRLVMVFVTEHGKPDERLLGIITAWDLAKFF